MVRFVIVWVGSEKIYSESKKEDTSKMDVKVASSGNCAVI